jgi:deoxyribonuclease-1
VNEYLRYPYKQTNYSNIKRSNFPYADFDFYQPEYRKGTVARAMLYFLVRYPRAIKKTFRRHLDLSLLIRWHQQFDVTIYEKHRNQAIYLIQGNRSPFINFPELAEQLDFKDILQNVEDLCIPFFNLPLKQIITF